MMKRSTAWKILRRLFYGFVVLIALAVLLLTEEYYRGKWAWEQYQREATARGMPFDPRPFIPPPVPDEQNFAMTPLLKPLFGPDSDANKTALTERLSLTSKKDDAKRPALGGMRNGTRTDLAKWGNYLGNPDVLEALRKFDPQLDEISTACRRPFARFPLRYEDGVMTGMHHLTPLIKIAQLYQLRALAALEAAQTDRALADVESIFQLAESVENEPLVISQLVRWTALFSAGVQVIWEGLEARQWSDGQLAALQSRLERVDLFTGALRSARYELAVFPDSMRKTLNDPKVFAVAMSLGQGPSDPDLAWEPFRFVLKNTLPQNMLAAYHFDEAYLLPAIDIAKRRVDVARIKEAEQKLQDLRGAFSPHTFLANMRSSAMCPTISKFAYTQTTIDQALVACALERYRLAHGEFPEKLDALIPQYLQKLPHDVINGQPLHYRRTDDGLFALYSVGWNETDDNGTVHLNKYNNQDIKQGDWAWRHVSAAEK